MKQKMTVLILSLALCLGLLPTAAMAAEGPAQRGVLTYTQAIAPQYEDAQEFSESLAAVKKDGKWGYIDETGKVVIPFQYDVAYVFNEGYAVVGTIEHNATRETEEWVEGEGDEIGHYEPVTVTYDACRLGFIDKAGNYKPFTNEGEDENDVIEASRDMEVVRTNSVAYIFHNGYVSIYDELYVPGWGDYKMWSDIFDTTGKAVAQGNRAAYPINEGVMIGGLPYDSSQCYEDMTTGETFGPAPGLYGNETVGYDLRPFNQGLAPVCVGRYDDNGDLAWSGWGFVDKTGNWVIEPMDHQILWIQGIESTYEIFGETGVALLGGEDGNWGGIDKTGKTVIPFQYDALHAASEGLMGFEEDGKWGFLDAGTLEVAIPAQFDQVTMFNNGYAVAAVKAADGAMTAHLIDRKGQAIPGSDKLDPETYFREDENFDDLTIYNPGEYVVIQENGKYGYGHIEYLPKLPQQEDMSGWAFEEVTGSIENDLVPVELQNLYGRDITRGEFCQLSEAIIEAVTDETIDEIVLEKTGKSLDEHLHTYPFGDTASRSVMVCYALGIVNGRGDGTFDPYASISRQEAATMLGRLADVLSVSGGQAVTFADADTFPAWAAQDIAKVSGLVDPTSSKTVMGGTGGGSFSPLLTYTREQAYTTALRLYHAAQAE